MFPRFKKVQVAKCIAIGGMIGMGKSTLATALAEELNGQAILELHKKDKITELLLEKLYERESDKYASVFQLYFALTRSEAYSKNANRKKITIFDRTIFEDYLFAIRNIKTPSVIRYYISLWDSEIKKLIYQNGLPAVYIILKGSNELMYDRIKNRGRKCEIDNLEKNKQYLEELNNHYVDYLVRICKNYNIEYLVVEADKPTNEQVSDIVKELYERKISY